MRFIGLKSMAWGIAASGIPAAFAADSRAIASGAFANRLLAVQSTPEPASVVLLAGPGIGLLARRQRSFSRILNSI
jgi:hypothetical protein